MSRDVSGEGLRCASSPSFCGVKFHRRLCRSNRSGPDARGQASLRSGGLKYREGCDDVKGLKDVQERSWQLGTKRPRSQLDWVRSLYQLLGECRQPRQQRPKRPHPECRITLAGHRARNAPAHNYSLRVRTSFNSNWIRRMAPASCAARTAAGDTQYARSYSPRGYL